MTCSECRYWRSFAEMSSVPEAKQTSTKGLCYLNPPVLVSPVGPEWKRPVTGARDPECADAQPRDPPQ